MRSSRAAAYAFLLGFLIVGCGPAFARCEACYSEPWCESIGGTSQVRLLDKTRPDCLTDTHVWEADFARGLKPYEAVGQALHYATVINRTAPADQPTRPGVALIKRRSSDEKYIERIRALIAEFWLPIDLVVIE